MKLAVLCSAADHPINPYLERWVAGRRFDHEIDLVRSKAELSGGDILFLISCAEIIGGDVRSAFRKVLVVHASDLPTGRGWSPHIWQIVEGKEQITVTLLEAADKVDSGDIWKQLVIPMPRHVLWDEINHLLFCAELELMDYALENLETVRPRLQDQSTTPTYYRRRVPGDSRIDPDKSIRAQFDLMRVCDPVRYPAFFELHGCRYIIRLEKIDE